jgi:hypothetical protein
MFATKAENWNKRRCMTMAEMATLKRKSGKPVFAVSEGPFGTTCVGWSADWQVKLEGE